jgi:ADP-ribose pyrophosphatase
MTTPVAAHFKGKIVEVMIEQVELPNGRTMELEIVRHPGGAAVVALDAKGRVCLLRQYRHVVGGWVWELPAGKLDPGEPPQATARRELAEETGVRAARWDGLGRVLSSPGIFTEVIHLFLARELERGETSTEEHELIEAHWLPLEQALARAASGEIVDAKSIAGLFRAQRLLTAETGA